MLMEVWNELGGLCRAGTEEFELQFWELHPGIIRRSVRSGEREKTITPGFRVRELQEPFACCQEDREARRVGIRGRCKHIRLYQITPSMVTFPAFRDRPAPCTDSGSEYFRAANKTEEYWHGEAASRALRAPLEKLLRMRN